MNKLVDIDFTRNRLTDSENGLTNPIFLRDSSTTDADGNILAATGAQLIDTAAQNDITDAWWGSLRIGNSTANAIIPDGTTNTHGLYNNLTLTAGTSYLFSAEFKEGNKSWVGLAYHDGNQKNNFFDLANGVVGNNESISGIEHMGGGWYRCYIVYSPAITSVPNYIYSSNSGSTFVFAGDNSTVSTYIRNIMLVELPSDNTIGDDLFDQESLGVAVLDDDCADDDTGDWTKADCTLTFDTDYYEIEVTSANTVYVWQDDITTKDTFYRISLDYYIPSTNVNVDELEAKRWTESGLIIDSLTATDVWTSVSGSFYYSGSNAWDDRFTFYLKQNESTTGLNVGDVVRLRNILIEPVTAPHKGTYNFPYSAGTEAITAQNDRDFSSDTQGSDLFDQEELGSDIPRTWAISTGSPTIDGDEITFADEASDVKDDPYEWSLHHTYKINVTISNYSGSGNIVLPYDGNLKEDIYGNSIVKSANGTYEYYYSPSLLERVFIYSYSGHTATVTVNSIQEVTSPHKGTYNYPYSAGTEAITAQNDRDFSSDTQGSDLFDQETLGSELITASDDSDFTTWGNVNWAGWSGASIADGTGKMEVTLDSASASGVSLATEEIGDLTIGNVYQLSVDAWQGTTTATSLYINIDYAIGLDLNILKTMSGSQTTFTVTFIADGTSFSIFLYSNQSDTGTLFIDNVSVKEVTAPHKGTYNWPYSAGDEAITAQNDRDFSSDTQGSDLFDQETLGSELVTNPDFDSDLTGWTNSGMDTFEWSAGTMHVVSDGTGAAACYHADTIAVTAGTVYRVYSDYTVNSGSTTTFGVRQDSAAGSYYASVFNNTTTYFMAPLTENVAIRIYTADGTSLDMNVNSISVKEITAPHKGTPNWPYLAGDGGGDDSDAIQDDNDRTFEDGTIGNWVVAGSDSTATTTYDGTNPGAEKVLKISNIAGDGSAYARLEIGAADDIIFAANTLYRFSINVYVPSGNTNKSVKFKLSDLGAQPDDSASDLSASTDQWVPLYFYSYISADITGYTLLGFSGNPTAGDILYFDDISIRPVQTSWIPYGTNTIEIDEDGDNEAIKISYVDNAAGASMTLANASDLTSDLTVGKEYKVTFDAYYANDDGDDPTVIIRNQADDADLYSVTLTTSQVSYEMYFEATHATGDFIKFGNMSGSEIVYIENMTIKDVTTGSNWTVSADGNGTISFDTQDIGGDDDKQILLTSYGDTKVNAFLSTTEMSLTANTLYRVGAIVYVPSSNTLQNVTIYWPLADRIPSSEIHSPTTDQYEEIYTYFYLGADVVGNISIGFNQDPADGDQLYIDDVTIRPVQTSWVPYGTNTIEIDESGDNEAIKFTSVDGQNGGKVYLRDAADLSDDLTVGNYYKVTATVKKTGGTSFLYVNSGGGFNVAELTASYVEYTFYFKASTVDSDYLYFASLDATDTVYIKDLTIKDVTTGSNWVIYADGNGTVSFDTQDLGGDDDKQLLLTSYGDAYLRGKLDIAASGASANLTANTLYRVAGKVQVPSTNTIKDVFIGWQSITGEVPPTSLVDLTGSEDTYVDLIGYFYLAADVVGHVYFGLSGNPTDGDQLFIDDITIRPISTSWIPYGTNTIEIDESGDNEAIKITYVDHSSGAYLYLTDSADLSANLTATNTYMVQFSAKVVGAAYINIDYGSSQFVGPALTASYVDYSIPFTHDSGWPTIAFSSLSATESVYIKDLTIKDVTTGSNWTTYADGNGALSFDTQDLGGADDKQLLLTSYGDTYAYADLSTSVIDLTVNTLYRVAANVYVPSSNTLENVKFVWGNLAGIPDTKSFSPTTDQFEEVYGYFYLSSDIIGVFEIGFNGNPTDGDQLLIDDVTIRPIQTSWVPYGTDTIAIDESGDNEAIVITYSNHGTGAQLLLQDVQDLSEDPVAGRYYKINYSAKESGGDIQLRLYDGVATVVTHDLTDSYVDYEYVIHASDTDLAILFSGMSGGESVYIKDITIRQFPALAMLTPPDFVNSDTIPTEPVYDNGLIINGYGINLLPYSEDFTQWTNSDTTDVLSLAGPDEGGVETYGGELVEAPNDITDDWWTLVGSPNSTANVLIANNVDQVHYIGKGGFSATTYLFSAELKAGDVNFAALRLYDVNENIQSFFNLGTGAIGAEYGSAFSEITDVGDGWYSCSITATKTASTSAYVYAALGDNDATYSGDDDGDADIEIRNISLKEITNATATTLTATDANGTIKYTLSPTIGDAEETFSIWMKRITGTGAINMTVDDGSAWTEKTLTSNWQRFYIKGTETAPVVGIQIETSGDAIGIFGGDLKPDNFLSQYIPTDGCPRFRSTEAAEDGVSGLSYEMSAAVKAVLDSGEGTIIVEYDVLQDYDAVNTGTRGIISVDDDSVGDGIMFSSTEGDLLLTANTDTDTIANVNWSNADSFITVARLSDANSKLLLSNKLNDTWDLNSPTDSDFSGFDIDDHLFFSHANELPIRYKRLTIYDTYLTDEQLLDQTWDYNGIIIVSPIQNVTKSVIQKNMRLKR